MVSFMVIVWNHIPANTTSCLEDSKCSTRTSFFLPPVQGVLPFDKRSVSSLLQMVDTVLMVQDIGGYLRNLKKFKEFKDGVGDQHVPKMCRLSMIRSKEARMDMFLKKGVHSGSLLWKLLNIFGGIPRDVSFFTIFYMFLLYTTLLWK